jgi:hypothetical protein
MPRFAGEPFAFPSGASKSIPEFTRFAVDLLDAQVPHQAHPCAARGRGTSGLEANHRNRGRRSFCLGATQFVSDFK